MSDLNLNAAPSRSRLNRAVRMALGIALAVGLSGCIVVPYHPYHPYRPYYYGY